MTNYNVKCRIIEEELKTFWPQWHVVKRLGGGAFGDVFEIYRDNFGIRETSALKMIQIGDDAEPQDLFLTATWEDSSKERDEQASIPYALRNEIQIMEALRGAPNVVIIQDFHLKSDSSSDTLFVRMELLNSFQQMMAERQRNQLPFTISEVLKIGRDICTALMFCEKKGIIHRDIKPANLFIDGFGNYKVGDFGASKRMDTVHSAQMMTSIGTISYMAPEVFTGGSYSNTVDIYALGLILYQLLNNCRVPFLPTEGAYTTKDIDSANYRRLHGTSIPSLAGKTAGGERISSRLDAVVRKACAMNPADRYQTAKEFYDALALPETVIPETAEKKSTPGYIKKAQDSPAPSASLQSRQQKIEQPVRKKHSGGNKLMIGIAVLLILLFAGVALAVLQRGGASSESTERTDLGVAAQPEAEKGSDSAEEGTAKENTAPKDESAEIVEIPDPVLKKAVQDALDIGDREITGADALSLTVFMFTGAEENRVKDITGLSAFKNLTGVYLDENQISDISELSELTNLTELSLYNNQVSDISALSELTNLTRLDLSDNQIRDINVLSGLTNLTSLDFYNNQISDVSVLSGLTNLTWLNLSYNEINDISALSGLTDLIHLELAVNQINDISALSGMTKLEELTLDGNMISDISALSDMTNLTWLNLYDNRIRDISALSGMTNLSTLYMAENPVFDDKSREEIMEVLSGAENLTDIDF